VTRGAGHSDGDNSRLRRRKILLSSSFKRSGAGHVTFVKQEESMDIAVLLICRL